MPRLLITKGPDGVGRDYAIGTECVVGRAADVDFTILDPNASRRHFRVSRDADGYVVEDLGSRNGTSVNGARVQRLGIRDGDVVRAGGTEMLFKQKDGSDPSSAGARPAAVTISPGVAAAPAAPADPAKKPIPAVVPSRRRSGW